MMDISTRIAGVVAVVVIIIIVVVIITNTAETAGSVGVATCGTDPLVARAQVHRMKQRVTQSYNV
jgi:hypothetical protein